VNNLLAADENLHRPLMWVWQPDSMCERTPNSMVKQIEHNVFVRALANETAPLVWWSPVKNKECQIGVESLDGLKKLFPELFAHNQDFIGKNISLFKSSVLSNFHLIKEFPADTKAQPLPDEIVKLLGVNKNNSFVGAYPQAQ
jgi:hypothetical protein